MKCRKGFKKIKNKCVKTKKSKFSKKLKKSLNKSLFTIISFALAFFFFLKAFHNWANSFVINLHFCNHTACIIFSIIWFVFGAVGIYFIIKKKEMKKIWYLPFIIILIIGIILMNLTYCDGGKMHFGFTGGFFSFLSTADSDTHTECKPGVDCAGDIVEVPIPPCMETDDGRDYITFGTILSGANLDDLCMGDILRERYCNSELTYTSEDIDCTTFGASWTCEEGECRSGDVPDVPVVPECTVDADCPGGYECLGDECVEIGEEKENTLALCTDGEDNDGDLAVDCYDTDCESFCEALHCGDGEDNDGDGLIDCADPDCDYDWFEGGCGDFEYSCEHNPTTPYPMCGGSCPVGSYCGIYNAGDGTLDGGWCECIPDGEVSCYESLDCTGWCDEGSEYICIGDSFGCYCEWAFDLDVCYDTDGGIEPTIPGSVYYPPLSFVDYCSDDEWVMEYWCTEEGLGSYGEFSCIELFGENGTCIYGKSGSFCIDGVS